MPPIPFPNYIFIFPLGQQVNKSILGSWASLPFFACLQNRGKHYMLAFPKWCFIHDVFRLPYVKLDSELIVCGTSESGVHCAVLVPKILRYTHLELSSPYIFTLLWISFWLVCSHIVKIPFYENVSTLLHDCFLHHFHFFLNFFIKDFIDHFTSLEGNTLSEELVRFCQSWFSTITWRANCLLIPLRSLRASFPSSSLLSPSLLHWEKIVWLNYYSKFFLICDYDVWFNLYSFFFLQ